MDNNQSTEQQALSQRVSSRDPSYRGNLASAGGMESTAGGGAGNVGGDSSESSESSESGRKNQEAPRLLPIKSFQNDLASISVRCYSRCPILCVCLVHIGGLHTHVHFSLARSFCSCFSGLCTCILANTAPLFMRRL